MSSGRGTDFALCGIDAHFDRLLRRAARHRIGFVQFERVFEAFGADAGESAPDHGELGSGDFVMEIDG